MCRTCVRVCVRACVCVLACECAFKYTAKTTKKGVGKSANWTAQSNGCTTPYCCFTAHLSNGNPVSFLIWSLPLFSGLPFPRCPSGCCTTPYCCFTAHLSNGNPVSFLIWSLHLFSGLLLFRCPLKICSLNANGLKPHESSAPDVTSAGFSNYCVLSDSYYFPNKIRTIKYCVFN